MQISESKRDALIRMSQFIFRKESEGLARDVQNDLVKTVLFNVGNTGLTVPQVISEIEGQMDLKGYPAPIVQSVVERLCDEKQLRKESNKYFLRDEESEIIRKTIDGRRRTYWK